MSKIEGDIINLSESGLAHIILPNDADPATVILDKNSIAKIENLEKCQNLKQLSLAGNRLVRMSSVAKLRQLTVLNLPSNSIVAIEGLRDLVELSWLNLSGNSIKVIEGLSNNIKLRHLDLSDNSISQITNISHLSSLRTLLLHGNILTTLENVPQSLPQSIVILSLAENEITDLNEVGYLSCLKDLEQLSLMNNPCVLMTASTPGFDSRPFIINWVPNLQVLDGYIVNDKERLRAEWLYSQGKGRHFKCGQHAEIIDYLSAVCPLTVSTQLESQEDAKLSQILSKQKHHKEELIQQNTPPEHSQHSTIPQQAQLQHSQTPVDTYLSSTTDTSVNQSFRNLYNYSKLSQDLEQTAGQNKELQHKLERAPLRAWDSKNDGVLASEFHLRQKHGLSDSAAWQLQEVITDDAKSQSSLLDSESTYLPVNIGSTKDRPMTAPAVSSPTPISNYPFYMQMDNRPATAAGMTYDAYDRRPVKPLNTELFKGRPSFQYSPPTQSGNEPALGAKKKTPPTAQAHDYDTSQEVSQIEQILSPPTKENVPSEEISQIKDLADRRAARRSASQRSSRSSHNKQDKTEKSDHSSIPVSKNSANLSRTHSDYIPGRYAALRKTKHSDQSKSLSVKFSRKLTKRPDSKGSGLHDSGVYSRPNSDAILGETLEEDHRAATMIQAMWRGYWAREHDPEVVSVRKEMRARRAEDHIVVLRSELDRQRKLYDEERHLRTLQMEAIRYLWKEVQSLQSWKSEVLTSQQFRTTVDSSHQDDSYNYSQEIQNTLERMGRTEESGRGTFSAVDGERQRELEKTCASLQNQVAQLSQALQSVSSVVFQSGIMTSGIEQIVADMDQTLLVTGYEDDELSSCDESYTGAKWGTVPHSLSPYPSEEEEQYFNSVPQLGCPTPPRNLRLEHKGDNSIVISWAPSKILDSSCREVNKPLLGYKVYIDEKPMAHINGLAALIHGLNPELTYKIYVKAVSTQGESNSSDIIMAALSPAPRKRTSSTDSNRSDSDKDSTESSDVIRHRDLQRQKRRIKSPRQDKRHSRGKEPSAGNQDRKRDRSEKQPSKNSNSSAENVFVQPKIHTHRRNNSKDLQNRVPDLDLHQPDSATGLPQPQESHRSPPAGSQRKSTSQSVLSETFTVESSGSLLQAISKAKSSLGMNITDSDQHVKTHKRKRSKDLKTSEIISDDTSPNQSSPSAGSGEGSNPHIVVEAQAKNNSNREHLSKSESDTHSKESKVQSHRRTRSKDYEWRKDIDVSSNVIQEKREVKKAWVKESPTGEVHGIPIIDARKRHSSGSRPSSPAPSDISDKSDKKRTVAELLEKFSSKSSANFCGTSSLGTESPDHNAALPPRSRRANSNEDVSTTQESRRTPTKNISPSNLDRRRTPSNGSESDASEISTSSAARQLDMDKKSGAGISQGVSKLLQKLQNFSKSQEESIQQRTHKMKKKSTTETPGIEEEHRRPRRISGGSEGDSVSERLVPQSDSSSQSDDPQMNKKPYKTHRRSGSDQKVYAGQQRQSSAPSTPSHTSAQSSPGNNFDDYTPRPLSNVKRTASFHGVTPSDQPDIQPRRSGSDENLYDKLQQQSQKESVFSRKQRQTESSNINVHHIPILSGAKLQKQPKQQL